MMMMMVWSDNFESSGRFYVVYKIRKLDYSFLSFAAMAVRSIDAKLSVIVSTKKKKSINR